MRARERVRAPRHGAGTQPPGTRSTHRSQFVLPVLLEPDEPLTAVGAGLLLAFVGLADPFLSPAALLLSAPSASDRAPVPSASGSRRTTSRTACGASVSAAPRQAPRSSCHRWLGGCGPRCGPGPVHLSISFPLGRALGALPKLRYVTSAFFAISATEGPTSRGAQREQHQQRRQLQVLANPPKSATLSGGAGNCIAIACPPPGVAAGPARPWPRD